MHRDMNEKDGPLVTFTIRDSEGSQITCLHVFMSNERAWAFRWLFLIVLPTLLGVAFLQLIQVVVTDGDSQETSQLDIAIAKFFPQALRVRCGWHLVNSVSNLSHQTIRTYGKPPTAPSSCGCTHECGPIVRQTRSTIFLNTYSNPS